MMEENVAKPGGTDNLNVEMLNVPKNSIEEKTSSKMVQGGIQVRAQTRDGTVGSILITSAQHYHLHNFTILGQFKTTWKSYTEINPIRTMGVCREPGA